MSTMSSLLGSIGVVKALYPSGAIRVNVDGLKYYFNPRMLTVVTGSLDILPVGSRVCVSAGYKSVSDAKDGPLQPGDVGVVKIRDDSDGTVKVKALSGEGKGRMWWYGKRALMLASATEEVGVFISIFF